MPTTLTRKQLYDLVWSDAMRTVAPRLGISDVGLKKICAKAGIPVPGRGHWAKREAGKKTVQAALPPRPPGMDDEVYVGGRRPWYRVPTEAEILGPLPDPPSFPEPIESVRERARKLVGHVPVPRLTDRWHPAVRQLLEKDERRREKHRESRFAFSWYAPVFDAPIEQRRLRLLNAIFLALAKAGGTGWTRGDKAEEIGIRVHQAGVGLALTAIQPPARRHEKPSGAPAKPTGLRLAIPTCAGNESARWEDEPGARLETQLEAIVVEILVAAEVAHRESRMRDFEWRVARKAALEEEARRRKIEEERRARELAAQRERERTERLLAQAEALRQAQEIRAYVEAVREAVGTSGSVTTKAMEGWAAWALAHADRIDPVINRAFLRLQESAVEEPSNPEGVGDLLDVAPAPTTVT